jgi:acyl-coenzyme A thioesterase PaaI-like protein
MTAEGTALPAPEGGGPSVQERYAPLSVCFGCGPANEAGLRIRSFEGADGELVATWRSKPEHHAFDGVLSGGIIGAILDCHANWAAAMAIMRARGADAPPATVTAHYEVRLRRPTPTEVPLRLRARAVVQDDDRAVSTATLESEGAVTATFEGTFVAVRSGHPAEHRWR